MEKSFETDNISLASFLLTRGTTLLEVVQDYPGHSVFTFSDFEKCIGLKKSFLNSAPAPAIELFSKREMLLSEIKNRNREGNKYGKSKNAT